MKKLLLISLMVLTLPVLGGGFDAVAGHVNVGGRPAVYCTPCGCPKFPECVCDPGEEPGPCGGFLIVAQPAKPLPDSSGTHGAAALLALVGVGLVARYRMSRR